LGTKLQQRFAAMQEKFEIIGDVRGKGPMLALELVCDRVTKEPAEEAAKKLTRRCFEKGLVILACGTHHNVVRFLMPLVITDEQLERGLAILEESFHEVTK
jgi:4-aminobutyrate aminotransferase/(S)-3-amino-2-methylpropionate transaminase